MLYAMSQTPRIKLPHMITGRGTASRCRLRGRRCRAWTCRFRGLDWLAGDEDGEDQAGDLALIFVGEAGLDHVDRGGQHIPDPDAEKQQSRYPPPDARVGPDQGQ